MLVNVPGTIRVWVFSLTIRKQRHLKQTHFCCALEQRNAHRGFRLEQQCGRTMRIWCLKTESQLSAFKGKENPFTFTICLNISPGNARKTQGCHFLIYQIVHLINTHHLPPCSERNTGVSGRNILSEAQKRRHCEAGAKLAQCDSDPRQLLCHIRCGFLQDASWWCCICWVQLHSSSPF